MAATTVRIPTWFQGPTGSGQGGWTAHEMEKAIGSQITAAIRAPIPLETDLQVVPRGGEWHLIDPAAPDQPIMIAKPWTPDVPATDAVAISDATEAGTHFPLSGADHPVPLCFSCGLEADSMKIHSGPLDDGRWSTDWTVPDWAVHDDGQVDHGSLWAAIDCAQAWYVGFAGGRRNNLTVQLAVDVTGTLVPGETYSMVAFSGDYEFDWDGRKRGACGAVFDRDGKCVARSRSFWVAIPD